MNDNVAAAVGLLSAMGAERRISHLAGKMSGQAAFLSYVAQDVQRVKAELLLSRAMEHGRDQDTEARLDRAEQAALVLAGEVRRLSEENGHLWTAIRNLSRRLEGRI